MEERDSCHDVGTRQGALTTREHMSAHELPTHDHHSRSLGTRYPGKSKPPKVEDSRARALALCPEIQARRRVSVSRCQIQTHSTINYLDFLWVVWHVFLRDSGGSETSWGQSLAPTRGDDATTCDSKKYAYVGCTVYGCFLAKENRETTLPYPEL